MKEYPVLFFWFGGLITENLVDLSRNALAPHLSGKARVEAMIQLREPAEQLALGVIRPAEYCRNAAKILDSGLSAAMTEERLLESAASNQAVVRIIDELPDSYQRWMVVDFPKAWYRECADRWKLGGSIFESQTVFIEDLRQPRLVPEVFYNLPARAGKVMDECLAIDPVARRAVQAMRHGLASIIYVYPERLVHELALQGIWQTDADVMHPGSSERVKIT